MKWSIQLQLCAEPDMVFRLDAALIISLLPSFLGSKYCQNSQMHILAILYVSGGALTSLEITCLLPCLWKKI